METEPRRRRREPKPRTVRIGDRSASIRGLAAPSWRDLSHAALSATWPTFVAGSAAAFLAVNALFAFLFWLSPEALANVPPGSWLYYLYFSIETLATVGYGDIHPQTHYGHVVASLEMFVGIFYAAVLTGLVFNRFSRPKARILFAKAITLTVHNRQPTLMVRIANERHNAIASATAKLWYIRREISHEGWMSRTFEELPLLRRESPAFLLSWTVYHVVDDASPLAGLSVEDLNDREALFTLTVEGHDESAAQVVRASRTYSASDLHVGKRYVDILEIGEDRVLHVDYSRFHDTTPDDGATSSVLPSAARGFQ